MMILPRRTVREIKGVKETNETLGGAKKLLAMGFGTTANSTYVIAHIESLHELYHLTPP
jgi:hypothetical protein